MHAVINFFIYLVTYMYDIVIILIGQRGNYEFTDLDYFCISFIESGDKQSCKL